MKKFFFLIMVIAVLGMLNVATTMTASGNKGSTAEGNYYKTFDAPELTIVSDAIAIDGTTVSPLLWTGAISIKNQLNAKEVENGDIEQWVVKDISPQSSMNITMTSDLQVYGTKLKARQSGVTTMNQNTTQMQAIGIAQWRNSNLTSNMVMSLVILTGNPGTAVPSVFPGTGIELSN